MRKVAPLLFAVMLTAWFVATVGIMASCSRGPDGSTFVPAPRAVKQTVTDVAVDAARWASASPDRGWSWVAPTGSMEPFFNEHGILLFVRYSGEELRPGMVAIFNRGDVPRCVHVITAVRDTHVYMSGYANRNSDGWFPKTSIEGLVVGQLYLP